MKCSSAGAWATSPGAGVFLLLALVAFPIWSYGCGSAEPPIPTGRRVWEGPGDGVASSGILTYERREIAQKVPLPACVKVGEDGYRFAGVTTFTGRGLTPPGLSDTFYQLDRWRLWTRPGPLEGQPSVFVTVRGSTGIVAEYERVSVDQSCEH